MPTAIAVQRWATDLAGPTLRLNVSGAPTSPPASYASNFATTVDGWAVTTGAGTSVAMDGTGPVPGIRVKSTSVSPATAARTVTGLTVGQTYKISAYATRVRGAIALGVTGIGVAADVQTVGRQVVSYSFTATATSHQVTATVTKGATSIAPIEYVLDTVTVVRTSGWPGTTITRTDDNGTRVLRVNRGGQDVTSSGTMQVYDHEASLRGPVVYTVTDGLGATASVTWSAELQTPAAAWITLPLTTDVYSSAATPPRSTRVAAILGTSSTRRAQGTLLPVIGSEAPVGNPGPLALRSGTVQLLCLDYAAAHAVELLLAAGDTALLRQQTFPGLDMYFQTDGVDVTPTELVAGAQAWLVTVSFREVAVP